MGLGRSATRRLPCPRLATTAGSVERQGSLAGRHRVLSEAKAVYREERSGRCLRVAMPCTSHARSSHSPGREKRLDVAPRLCRAVPILVDPGDGARAEGGAVVACLFLAHALSYGGSRETSPRRPWDLPLSRRSREFGGGVGRAARRASTRRWGHPSFGPGQPSAGLGVLGVLGGSAGLSTLAASPVRALRNVTIEATSASFRSLPSW